MGPRGRAAGMAAVTFVRATSDLLPVLDAIREAAFAPVFASFRSLLGDEIYEAAQAREDARQTELLAALVADGVVYAAKDGDRVVGFVTVKLDNATKIGEIGL